MLCQEALIQVIVFGSIGLLATVSTLLVLLAIHQQKVIYQGKILANGQEVLTQRMVDAQLESIEKERVRISKDLHDSIGSLLWSAKLNASYIERVSRYNEESKKAYNELMMALDTSIETVRRIAWEMIPMSFEQNGLCMSVKELCARLTTPSVSICFNTNYEKQNWNDVVAMSCFRIIQELLNNSMRHSSADRIEISIMFYPLELEITVADNGIGIIIPDQRSGVGWWIIEHRAKQLNAEIQVERPPVINGTKVTLKIPR